jgi:hypothetical protein
MARKKEWMEYFKTILSGQIEANSDGYIPCGRTNPSRFKSQIWRECYIFMANYFLVVDDVHINNEMLFNRLCEFQDQTDTVVPLPLLHLKNATMQQNSTCA